MAPGGDDLRRGLHRWSPAVELRRFHGGGFLLPLYVMSRQNVSFASEVEESGRNEAQGKLGGKLYYSNI